MATSNHATRISRPHRTIDPLTATAATSPLVVLVDVDSLCAELNGRIDRELVNTLRMVATCDVHVVLVSSGSHMLAAALHVDLEGAWWCDRTSGWFDGPPERDGETPFAAVLAQLRSRLPGSRVLALSNDRSLWAALDPVDRIIGFGQPRDASTEAPPIAEQLIDAMWCVIEIRTHHRRFRR
jgi:hypothetical protein